MKKELNKLIVLDHSVSLNREFKICLKPIFGFSYLKLRHLNKVFGTNIKNRYKISELYFEERNFISFYLPELAIFGVDLKQKILFETEKFFSLKCYKRNRFVLGLPANGQRTHTNAKTCKRLSLRR